MDQIKIGSFLKKLRNEKSLTQEQLAECFNVSSRTVSRWENGNNLPDLSLLVELADFYQVEIRELIDGERRSEKMDQVEKDTLLKVTDYSNEEKVKLLKRINRFFIAGLVALTEALAIILLGLENTEPYDVIAGLGLGITLGMIISGAAYTSRYASKYAVKIRNAKIRLFNKIKDNLGK